jgi:dTMP kinase
MLAAHLRDSCGKTVVQTREPGGSTGAEAIRQLLVTGDVERWDGATEALLHFAARRDHLVRTVWPALDRGAWVLCDRFADSTLAYQGYGHGFDRSAIASLYRLTADAFLPALTLVFDIPVEQGLRRAAGRRGGEDRYERLDRGFHERVRAGFLEIARSEPGRCILIDATRTPENVHAAVRAALAARLGI